MSSFTGSKDDIHYNVLSKDLADVYMESQREPDVNTFVKKLFHTMKEPSFLDWKLNVSGKVSDDAERGTIIRSKLESILRSERLSQYLDENGISLNSYNAWVKRKYGKTAKKDMRMVDLPEWVRRYSKKNMDDLDEDDKERSALLGDSKKGDEEKKPKKPENDN
ncbi:hypothetical protein EDI_349790 [Entamoeba dispar SAW760]|uniref:Uncharacterized protein n=1 Tax=Entamoeba dispar (strain ATCC PRA-260 / SAW760) TaxID=370354 RepID=B0E5K0_ENTDS|nr:uncharacterized protein EDI_349790 [Entamoeba dispar SAW760]EDR30194.1 hypothetical protein EDI_349790 [Entamoeba dispar SAW760]|eukprot:EDR30194.1 hypothetical protein EDI_349790 [Entamoeba dispar SAW760]